MSLREQLLRNRLAELPREAVELNGVKFFVRTMTGAEMGRFIKGAAPAVADGQVDVAKLDEALYTDLLIVCACDESGAAIFSPEDAVALASSASYLDLQRVYEVAAKLNGLGVGSIAAEGKD